MKKLVILILLVICFLADHILAIEPGSSERPSYAPGELLVKHKSSVRAAATQYYRTQWDISALRTFRVTGVQHVKLPRGMTVEAALAKLCYLISRNLRPGDIKKLIQTDMCGELSIPGAKLNG